MRVPEPFKRTQTNSYYVQIRGKQISLGKDRDAAWQKYHRLMAGETDLAPSTPAAVIIDQFLEWVSINQAPATYDFYKRHLTSFARFIGARLRVSELKPYHVTRWVDREYKGQSNTSKFAAFRSAQRSFNWARKQGIIQSSPIERLDKPTPGRREDYISPEQYAEIVRTVKARPDQNTQKPFLEILTVLWGSGCRPQEARAIEARHYDKQRGVIIFERQLSKGKKRRRVIHLPPDVREIIERLAAERPKGPILLNSKGQPWKANALRCRFRCLAKKLGFPAFAYGCRHGFTTDLLKNGVDSTTVAALLGNTTTRMIETCYSHVDADDKHMQTSLKRTNA
jgi:integrase